MIIATAQYAAAIAVSPAQLTVGDRSTRASNPRSILEDAKNAIVTGTVTVTNDGNETLNNLRLGTVVPKLGFQITDLKLNATFAATTLAVNASTTATISVRIPEKLDAVTSQTFKEAAFNVADFTVLATGATTGTSFSTLPQLFLQRKNELVIKDIEVCVNDRCKTVRNNGDVENIRPGDKIDLKVEVENRYSSSDREDLDIEDADLEFEIDDRNFDESDRESLSDIGSDSETEESFSFDIEDDVRDGSYKLVVKTFGRDELGALHGEINEVRLKVERDAHDIEIRRVTASPSTFPCTQQTGRSGRVTISATNIGRRDEARVAFELFSGELGIKERVENLRMDRDNSRTESLSYSVPDSAKPGTYQLVVRSFFDNTAQSGSANVPVVIPDCTAQIQTASQTTANKPQEPSPSTTPIAQPPTSRDAELLARLSSLQNQVEDLKSTPTPQVVQPVPATVRKTTSEPVKSTTGLWSSGFQTSGLYIALLSGVIVLIVIVLIALIIKFLAPRP